MPTRQTQVMQVGYGGAVVMPAKGFKVTPGSDESAMVIPFAFRESTWERFEEAQQWFYQPAELAEHEASLTCLPIKILKSAV